VKNTRPKWFSFNHHNQRKTEPTKWLMDGVSASGLQIVQKSRGRLKILAPEKAQEMSPILGADKRME